MTKQANLTLTLHPTDQVSLKVGDTVKPGDILIEPAREVIEEFDMVKPLGVKPEEVYKYFTKKSKDKVIKGEVIAQKKSVLHKHKVKSPLTGVFLILDKNKGLAGVKHELTGNEIKSWFNGKVVEKTKEKVIFEVKGKTITASDGKGHPVSGKLIVSIDSDMLDLPTEIEECILAIKDATDRLIAKADALGAVGVIAETVNEPPFGLPYVIVEDITSLHPFHERQIVVYGDEQQVLVLES